MQWEETQVEPLEVEVEVEILVPPLDLDRLEALPHLAAATTASFRVPSNSVAVTTAAVSRKVVRLVRLVKPIAQE